MVRTSSTFPNFKQFVEFIEEHAKISNHSLWDLTSTSPRVPAKPAHAAARAGMGRTFDLPESDSGETLVTTSGGSSKGKRLCPCCDEEGHMPNTCPTMTAKTQPERMKLVAEKRLCFGCLHSGHRLAICKYKTKCKSCHRFHHDLLQRND